MDGKSQESSAAAAGMSVRTARKWESGSLPSTSKEPRSWRTRRDPFEGVWDEEIVPLLMRDEDRILQATTLLELLDGRYPAPPPHRFSCWGWRSPRVDCGPSPGSPERLRSSGPRLAQQRAQHPVGQPAALEGAVDGDVVDLQLVPQAPGHRIANNEIFQPQRA